MSSKTFNRLEKSKAFIQRGLDLRIFDESFARQIEKLCRMPRVEYTIPPPAETILREYIQTGINDDVLDRKTVREIEDYLALEAGEYNWPPVIPLVVQQPTTSSPLTSDAGVERLEFSPNLLSNRSIPRDLRAD